jgi:anaerobic magnesium-protoporphyrin IX monomethyl ester cyclase
MKIGLIDPGSKKLLFNENFPHIGLAYVAAVLVQHGHEVNCLDVGLAGPEATEKFLAEEYDLMGLSVTSFTLREAVALAHRVRERHPGTVIVLGGPHVAIGMEETLNDPMVDYAVCGEGEMTLLELTETLSRDRHPAAERRRGIPGLLFRDGTCVVRNPGRPRIENLDTLPWPAFDLFDMDQYGMYPILTSRGCPFGCSFCSIKVIWGTRWQHRSAENVIAEIAWARQRYHWTQKPFNVIDDSFNVNPERVMQFCRGLIDRGMNIQWFSSGFRADRVSPQLAQTMRESGCIGVSVGIESASDEVLKRIGKKETIAQCTEGCRNLAQAGIAVQAQFMIGNPGDTMQTIRQSLTFARQQPFAQVAFYLALPYPKTELWDYVRDHGRFLRDDYTQFHHFSSEPVFETPEFPAAQRRQAYQMGRRLAVRTKLRQELRTKWGRIRRGDFHDLDLQRVRKATGRLSKYFLDLTLRRDERV